MTTYLYFLAFIVFSLFTYLFVDINFPYFTSLITRFNLDYRTEVTVVFFLLTSILFLLYTNAVLTKKTFKISPYLIIPILIGLLSYPAIISYDIFNYIATAKVSFFYLENPYVIMPIEFLGDPILAFTHAANKLALYGPFWVLLSSIPFILSMGNYLFAVFLFKLFAFSFYLGILYLLYKLTNNKLSLVIFGLSPLVVIETVISGHNDVVMMFFGLLSFYFLKNKRIVFAIIAIVLSILIKYATVFLIPVFAYVIYKQYKKDTIDWEKVWLLSLVSMFSIFILSFLRVEIYPWYAIWPLTFVALIPKRKELVYISIALSYGLMLRYVPYMLIGDHFGVTPIIKVILTFLPVVLLLTFLLAGRKIKLK